MKRQPMRFFVEYESDALFQRELARVDGVAECAEYANYSIQEDAASLTAARALARLRAKENTSTVWLYERVNLRKEYFDEENPQLSDWYWENAQLGEYTRGRGFTMFEKEEMSA